MTRRPRNLHHLPAPAEWTVEVAQATDQTPDDVERARRAVVHILFPTEHVRDEAARAEAQRQRGAEGRDL